MIWSNLRRAYAQAAAGPLRLDVAGWRRAPGADPRPAVDELEQRFHGTHLWRCVCWVFRREMLAILVSGLAAAALTLAVPWRLRAVFAGLDRGGNRRELVVAGLVVTVLLLARLAADRWHNWLERRLMFVLQVVVQRVLFRRLQRVSSRYLRDNDREPLSYLSGYSLQLTQLVYLVSLLISSLTFVGAGVLLLYWSGAVGLLVLGAVVAFAFALRAMIVVIGRVYYRYVDVDHARTTFLRLVATGLSSVRRQQLEPQVLTGLADVRARQVAILRRRAWWQTLNRTLEDGVAPVVALLLVGVSLWSTGALLAADVFPLLLVVRVILDAVAKGLADYRVLRVTRDPSREIEALFRAPVDVADAAATSAAPGTVQLHLPGERRYTVPPGGRLAIVGASGADTTGLLLACAGVPSDEGARLSATVAGSYVLVGRNQPTFDASVAEHVVLWERPVDRRRYFDAMGRAGLAGEFNREAAGDGRLLNAKNPGLSEGQAQRLALAQALYTEPDVLVIDDVFASLNPNLAERVAAAVLHRPDPITCIYRTSRLELVTFAESVLLVGRDGNLAIVAVDDLTRPAGRETCQRLLDTDLAARLCRAVERTDPSSTIASDAVPVFHSTHDFGAAAEVPTTAQFDTTTTATIRLLDFAHNVRALFSGPVVAALASVLVIAAAGQIAFASLIDQWSGTRTATGTVLAALAAVTALTLLSSAMRYVLTYRLPIVTTDRLHLLLFRQMLSGDPDTDHRDRVLGRLTQDFRNLEMETPNAAVSYAATCTDGILYVAFIAALNPLAFVLLVPFIVAAVWTYRRGRLVSVDAARMSAGVRGPALNFIPPAMGALGYRVSASLRDKLSRRFDELTDIQVCGVYWAELARVRLGIRIEALGIGMFLVTLWAVLLYQGPWSAGVSGVLVFLAASLSEKLTAFITSLQTANVTAAQFDRLAELLDRRYLPPVGSLPADNDPESAYTAILADDRPAEPAQPAGPAVSLHDARFAFDGGRPVFERLSLTVQPRELVAVTGQSGQGKSTLAYAIGGSRRLSHGRVLVGGHPPVALGRQTRAAMIHLDSDLPDLPLMVHDVVDPFRRHSTEDIAQLLADVAPGSTLCLDTKVTTLDHAGRQTVNIVRALLAGPHTLLLLDEATSALDVVHERHVLAAIRRRLGSAAGLAIMHRPDNLDCFDRIIPFDRTTEHA